MSFGSSYEEMNVAFEQVLESLGLIIEQHLRVQVPRPGNNPNNEYATGALRNSLTYNIVDNRISFSYSAYGTYVDLGTYDAYQNAPARFGTDPQDLPPFAGYFRNRNVKGIQPQYWTSMREIQPEIQRIIESTLADASERALASQISTIGR